MGRFYGCCLSRYYSLRNHRAEKTPKFALFPGGEARTAEIFKLSRAKYVQSWCNGRNSSGFATCPRLILNSTVSNIQNKTHQCKLVALYALCLPIFWWKSERELECLGDGQKCYFLTVCKFWGEKCKMGGKYLFRIKKW